MAFQFDIKRHSTYMELVVTTDNVNTSSGLLKMKLQGDGRMCQHIVSYPMENHRDYETEGICKLCGEKVKACTYRYVQELDPMEKMRNRVRNNKGAVKEDWYYWHRGIVPTY